MTSIEWGEGLALRYGGFYGPGTSVSLAPDAVMAAPIRKRQFPIVGDGGGVWSHVHIEDAATATTAAVEQGRPGVYYIVDVITPRRCGSGCRCWRMRWIPSRQGVSPAGWGGWRPVRWQRS